MERNYTSEAIKLLCPFFKDIIDEQSCFGDPWYKTPEEAAGYWLEHKNPQLGGMTPNEIIALGHGEQLLQFIQKSISANSP